MTASLPRSLIYGLLLAAGTVLLFVGGPDYHASRSLRHLWDLGHIAYFVLLAGLLVRIRFIKNMSVARQWAIILSITLLVGVSIELLQSGTSRMPDGRDVLRDVLGSVLVLVFGSPAAAIRRAGYYRYLRIGVLLALAVALWPLAKSLIDEEIARRDFPLLSGFDTPFELDRWTGSAGRSIAAIPEISDSRLMEIALTGDRYSGVALEYFEGEWSSYRTLDLSLYNPDATPFHITCRIHDLAHIERGQAYEDRYNRSFLISTGWNRIRINLAEVRSSPANRSMDMDR
ncbi:MAG: VanZ family protein, partial [Thiohalobacterales bacterium]|nr:VanZ family protein [Thiohalobacterales bacterium]